MMQIAGGEWGGVGSSQRVIITQCIQTLIFTINFDLFTLNLGLKLNEVYLLLHLKYDLLLMLIN